MAPNSGVNIGGHARRPSTSQAYPTPAASEENDVAAVRSNQAEPLTSEGGSESQTHGQAEKAFGDGQDAAAYTLKSQLPTEPATPTMEDIQFDIYCTIEIGTDPEVAQCFQRASILPPITSETLTELDMPRILNNPKLRHDVNFDRELHFRPNLDGSRGREKVRLSDDYWKALEGELFMYGNVLERRKSSSGSQNEAYWQEILAASQSRLPKLFETIRDILKTLVPDYDQKIVMERLDKDLLMQQIQNGVCDLVDLANWLAKILKNHCAPMRDNMVDRMQSTIKQGALEDKPATLVDGNKQLLTILEAMKLDVANHQVRHMRPLLIDDTINFQGRYSAHRIGIGKIVVKEGRTWFDNEMEHLRANDQSPTGLEVLASASLRGLLYNSSKDMAPSTFYLDVDRLKALRTDCFSRIYHAICADIFCDLAPKNMSETERRHALNGLHMSIAAIVGTSGKFMERQENIAAEIMRIVMAMEGGHYSFDERLLSSTEARLFAELRPHSQEFDRHRGLLFDRLIPKINASVQQSSRLSALLLQDRFVPALPPLPTPLGYGAVCGPVMPQHSHDPDEDVIHRMTHMLVLHWHVWADLVYLTPAEDDVTPSSSSDSSPTTSAAASPMMPVAQAVYAPGRKWLPIGIKVTEVPSGLPTPLPSPTMQDEQSSPPSSSENDSSPQSPSSAPPPADFEQQK